MKNKENIIIFDTTLRDGEQSPGATMTLKEKVAVARLLDTLGVNVIEAGFAAASLGDMHCIQEVAKAAECAKVCSLARAKKGDIVAAAKSLEKARNPRIHTFMSTSPIHIEHQFKMTEAQVLSVIDESVRQARYYCDDVEWSAMDATRTPLPFLEEAVRIAIAAGASTINIPDTVGYTMPHEYQQMMAALCTTFPDVIFSVHCHNDLGLATANALAGVLGGARQIECTVNGIGERAGNTALEEVVMALHTRPDIYPCTTQIQTQKIYPTSRFVAAVAGFPIQKNKAIVGQNAFAHESGIHQDGMLKNRDTYEIMTPDSVGISGTELSLGKHSGRAAIKDRALQWGIDLNADDLQTVCEQFKDLCDRKKQTTEEDLLGLIQNQHTDLPASARLVRLTAFATEQVATNHYQAKIDVLVNGFEKQLTATGHGPLDAVFDCLNAIFPEKRIHLISFETHSLSEGTDAQAEAHIALKLDDKLYKGHARDTDTLVAATQAYLNALNKGYAEVVADVKQN